jgi:hypothetical protein
MNLTLILQLLIELGSQISNVASLVRNAQAAGRDVTDAELQTLRDAYAAAHKALDDAIG